MEADSFKTIASPCLVPATYSSKKQNAENSPSALDPADCLKRAKVLACCYRRDAAHDPEVYAAAIAAVLGDYAPEIVDRATDPRTGIASECKWLPSVAEVREFCDGLVQRARRLAEPSKSHGATLVRAPERLPGQYSYAEFLQMAARGEVKSRPIGRYEPKRVA